jgi:signal transduction histidine kinase
MTEPTFSPLPHQYRANVRTHLLWLAVVVIFLLVLISTQINTAAVLLVTTLGVLVSLFGFVANRYTRRQLLDALHQSQEQQQRAISFEERATASEQRSQIFHKLAGTMSLTLDHNQILETALHVGTVGLKNPEQDVRLIAAAFLFRNSDNQLHIATAQRLTTIDMKKPTPGHAGVLRRAIEASAPVFAGPAADDPELSYYIGIQKARSTVAIPLQASFQNYGILIFGSEDAEAFTAESADVLATLSLQVTVALQNAVLYQNLVDEKERIVRAEEQARKKLSRDLHDGPTQTISAIAMRINAIQGLIRNGNVKKAHQELGKVFDMSEKTTKQIRHMLFAMRPLVLENQGLIAALHEMSNKYADTYELEVLIEADDNAEDWLEEDAQGALFYVVEEAVNNARKHAKAERVIVRIYRQGEYCIFEIEDNGVGFNVDEVNDDYHKRGSLGMVSMRERAELADGELKLQSKPGTGTRILVRIPLPPEFHQATTRKILVPRHNPHQQRNDIPLNDTRFTPRAAETVDPALDE